MRRLLLLRHAKAERLQPGGRDHDRSLAELGRADAKKLGVYLARHSLVPDQALVSNAARTRETWALLAAAFAETPPVRFEDRLYAAAPQAILQIIKDSGRQHRTLLVIGHNPSLQELAATLIASGDIDARERLGEEFPTAALAAISFAAADWTGVHPRGGRLEHFISPKWLATATD
jgi:phosphohistidine phosphatase